MASSPNQNYSCSSKDSPLETQGIQVEEEEEDNNTEGDNSMEEDNSTGEDNSMEDNNMVAATAA